MDILSARFVPAGAGPLHTAPLCAGQRESLLRAARAALRRTEAMLEARTGPDARTHRLRAAAASLRAEIAELEDQS